MWLNGLNHEDKYKSLQILKNQILRLMSLFCEQCQKYKKNFPVSPGLNSVSVKIL